jgi:DNA repair exonuclease SbcCD ATPase subunit
MHLISAVFKNFGRHEHLSVDFSKGLVGIVGPNGSGKSTITDGIYSTLTGDFSRFDGVKTDNINDMAPENAPSYIELIGEHDGVQFTLRRSLRPNHSRLTIGGEEELTKAGEIQTALEDSLGINNKLIDAYVFVSQWRMFEFLSQTSSKRAEAFQHLCNTERAAVIHALAGKELDTVGSIGDIVDNSDDLRKQIAKRQKELAAAEKKRDSVKEKRLTTEKRNKANDFLARWDRCLRLDKLIAEAEEKCATHAQEMDDAEEMTERKKTLRDELRELVEELRPQADEARVAIAQFESHRRAKLTKAQVEKETVKSRALSVVCQRRRWLLTYAS